MSEQIIIDSHTNLFLAGLRADLATLEDQQQVRGVIGLWREALDPELSSSPYPPVDGVLAVASIDDRADALEVITRLYRVASGWTR